MKILFKNRVNSFKSPGGDTIQMMKTKEYLEKEGIKVDISLESNSNLKEYDLVHIFNCMRPLETSAAIFQAKEQNKKVVLSSIYWDFDEFNLFGRSHVERLLYRVMNEFSVEKLKDFLRINHLKFNKKYLRRYYLRNYKNTLKLVDIFLPNSSKEGEIIQKKIYRAANYHVINNAVDKNIFKIKSDINRKNETILASRIDPRKNILNLVKAIKTRKVNIYGDPSNFHSNYFDQVKKHSNSNINFNSHVEPKKLADLYNAHLIHILPSWLETPGLSQLEAAACGCNIVSTSKGSAVEYFGNMAKYCDPSNIESIERSLEDAYENPIDPNEMSEYILDKYTWEITCKQTIQAYNKVLN